MPANALELNAAEALLQLQLGVSNCTAQLESPESGIQVNKKKVLIAEIKSIQTCGTTGSGQQSQVGPNLSLRGKMTTPQVVADTGRSYSECDSEAHCGIIRRHNTSAALQNTYYNREATLNSQSRQTSEIQCPDFTGRFMICSTPISETNQFSSLKPMAVSINGSRTPMIPTSTVKVSPTPMTPTSTIKGSPTPMTSTFTIKDSPTPMAPTSTIKGSDIPMKPISTIKRSHVPVTPILKCDQGTQTDESITGFTPTTLKHYTEQIDRMEIIIKELYSHFLHLTTHLNTHRKRPLSASMHPATDNASTSDTTEPMESEPEIRSSLEQDVSNTTGERSGSNSNGSIKGELTPNARMLHVRRMSAHTTSTYGTSNGTSNYNKTELIGYGNTVVPSRVLKTIDWTSYSTATRQLLRAVFPRRVLATHSLTGKQSPAFMNKPPKQRLDPHVVNDIVDTVADRCGVSKSLVRSSITTKCADESKLYRNRQQNRRARPDQENVPPSASSGSDESVAE